MLQPAAARAVERAGQDVVVDGLQEGGVAAAGALGVLGGAQDDSLDLLHAHARAQGADKAGLACRVGRAAQERAVEAVHQPGAVLRALLDAESDLAAGCALGQPGGPAGETGLIDRPAEELLVEQVDIDGIGRGQDIGRRRAVAPLPHAALPGRAGRAPGQDRGYQCGLQPRRRAPRVRGQGWGRQGLEHQDG